MALSVERSFENRRVLLTGASGFLGKVILERLLSEVPGIGGIVVLLRPSARFPDVRVRLEREVLGSSIFDSLRASGRFERRVEKVECLAGELTEPRLGLAPDVFRALGERVDLVVNGAASVDFREPIDRALRINVHALDTLIELVREGDGRLLHISTCYVHGRRSGIIREENNPPVGGSGAGAEEAACPGAAELLRHLDERVARIREAVSDEAARERRLIDCGVEEAQARGWNDSYTMTKWLGEQRLFDAFGRGGRLCVVRPAIVEGTLSSPVPGWVEGVKVADALFVAYARGKVGVFPGRRKGILDLMPADLVANTVVLAAAELLGLDAGRPIYHAASSVRNPISLGYLGELVSASGREDHAELGHLFPGPPRRPFVMIPQALFVKVMSLSGWLDRVERAVGRGSETRRVKAEATRKLALIYAFYTSPTYRFDASATLAMAERFGDGDRARFVVDAAHFDWAHYIRRVHLPGLDRYALKPLRLRAPTDRRADDGAARVTCSGSSARPRPRARPR